MLCPQSTSRNAVQVPTCSTFGTRGVGIDCFLRAVAAYSMLPQLGEEASRKEMLRALLRSGFEVLTRPPLQRPVDDGSPPNAEEGSASS